MSPSVLITIDDHLALRPWQAADLDDLVASANNPNIAAYMTDAYPNPYTHEAGALFIKNLQDQTPPRILAIVYQGRAVGSIGIHPATDINRLNAELGYFLAEPYWGRGITTRAVCAMIRYGFQALPVNRIYARPFPHNTASRRVLEKAGFELEATIKDSLIKNGVVMDELIFAVRRGNWAAAV